MAARLARWQRVFTAVHPPSTIIHHPPSIPPLSAPVRFHPHRFAFAPNKAAKRAVVVSELLSSSLPSCEGGGVVGGGQRHRLMFNPLITVGLSVRRVDKWQCDGCEHVLLVLVMCVKAAHKVVFSTVRIVCGLTLN